MAQRSRAPRGDTPEYIVIFSVSDNWAFPRGFEIKQYKGLKECQLVQLRGKKSCLVTRWTFRDLYQDCWEKTFAQQLDVGTPTFTGYDKAVLAESTPWWKNLTALYAATVTFVAVATNFEAVYGVIHKVSEAARDISSRPAVATTVANRHILLPVGEQREFEYTFTNESRGRCEVTLSSIDAAPSGQLSTSPLVKEIRLEKDQQSQVKCRVVAAAPGVFTLKPIGKIRSGAMFGSLTCPVGPPVIAEVWPRVDYTPTVTLSRGVDGGAIFLVAAKHGAPPASQLRYQITFKSDQLRVVSVSPGTIENLAADGGVATAVWTHIPTALQTQTFSVTLSSESQRSKDDWNSLKPEIYVEF